MTDEDMKQVERYKRAQKVCLDSSDYNSARTELAVQLATMDFFTKEESISLSGARHWVRRAQLSLDKMHAALVAAEAAKAAEFRG